MSVDEDQAGLTQGERCFLPSEGTEYFVSFQVCSGLHANLEYPGLTDFFLSPFHHRFCLFPPRIDFILNKIVTVSYDTDHTMEKFKSVRNPRTLNLQKTPKT